jgi:hypothetical protein
MDPTSLDWIKEGLKKPGKTRSGLARALNRAPSSITSLLQGKRELKTREVRVIADYLGFGPLGEIETAPGLPVVRVVGYVGAGAKAHFYAVAQGDLDEVAAPEGATAETVAVEVRGSSLGALFDSWLVFYDDVRRPVTSDLIGKLCVVGLADERVLVKKIKRAHDGLYDLVSNTEDPIKDVPIDWAAKVKIMVPR